MPGQDETHEALSSPTYQAAFNAVMLGTEPAMLPEAQRNAINRVRELTGTPGPGLPMPLGLDPTRQARVTEPEPGVAPDRGDGVA